MSWEAALRATELLLAIAVIQRGAEHLWRPYPMDRTIFVAQILLAVLLLIGIAPQPILVLLWLALTAQLWRYQGPYNGGADKMVFLVATCLVLAETTPQHIAELAFAYLAVQVVLSYFVSGWIKIIHQDWRTGQALCDIFAFSAYPVSDATRGWAARTTLLKAMSWVVMGFELVFPLAMLHPVSLGVALTLAMVFHLSNAVFLGLNRFLWAWISAYPALLWLQGRLWIPA